MFMEPVTSYVFQTLLSFGFKSAHVYLRYHTSGMIGLFNLAHMWTLFEVFYLWFFVFKALRLPPVLWWRWFAALSTDCKSWVWIWFSILVSLRVFMVGVFKRIETFLNTVLFYVSISPVSSFALPSRVAASLTAVTVAASPLSRDKISTIT